MHAWNYFPMLAQLLFLLSLCNTRHTASWETCPRDSNFTTNSTYHFNLNLLLPSLTSATVSTGYANTSAGRSPDQVFGLARCQLDVSQDKCQACLATAVDTLRSSCPSAKDAATWGDLCFLAYSNTTFSNDRDKSSFAQIIVNGREVSETSRFVNLVGELMNALINRAAYKTDMFAIGQVNFTSFTKVYGLVQCTRDQSDDDCFLCIRQSLALMQSCCLKNQGGVVLKYKCFLRYETYPFYNLSVATSPLPPLSSAFSSAPPPGATANPPPPPAVVDSNSSSSSARDAGKLQYIIKLSVAVVIPILGAVMLVAALLIFLWRTKIFARKSKVGGANSEKPNSLLFDFETLKVATNNFSDANKLGEGGFGPVYKGVLSDGQEVAVKRLARSSQQGFAELRNEVAFVAKLQHRNLVRLIGFCSEEEKLLVYEFLPNTSLDKILFADPTKCGQLNWERRYKIIEGIARGLLYLHEDSRLRIIHRDLKPGNILLDQHMNPKISDFGLSKLLVDQDRSEESASRIVGTNGYIAPEYALLRHVSDKSDVYSYGVLVLEIITGRRISEFRGSGHRANLQSYAWKNWNKGKALQIVDQNLCGRFQREEALPCIRTALLCVQENPSKRPTMASVVRMLSSSSMTTLSPSAPGFLIETSGTTDSNESTGNRSPEIKNEREGSSTSINEVSITRIDNTIYTGAKLSNGNILWQQSHNYNDEESNISSKNEAYRDTLSFHPGSYSKWNHSNKVFKLRLSMLSPRHPKNNGGQPVARCMPGITSRCLRSSSSSSPSITHATLHHWKGVPQTPTLPPTAPTIPTSTASSHPSPRPPSPPAPRTRLQGVPQTKSSAWRVANSTCLKTYAKLASPPPSTPSAVAAPRQKMRPLGEIAASLLTPTQLSRTIAINYPFPKSYTT
ncbi:unnamed protein product [Musa acuminata subsp. burmannicoides]